MVGFKDFKMKKQGRSKRSTRTHPLQNRYHSDPILRKAITELGVDFRGFCISMFAEAGRNW